MSELSRPHAGRDLLRTYSIEAIPSGESKLISAADTAIITDKRIRNIASLSNRRQGTQLVVHKNPDGSVWVWNDPNPRAIDEKQLSFFDKLIALQGQFDLAKGDVIRQADIHGEIMEVLATMQAREKDAISALRHRSKNAVWQPLEVVLQYYKIPKERWMLFPERLRSRKHLEASIEITKRMRAEAQANDKA